MKKIIVALLLFISCTLSAQTVKLSELTLSHTRNNEKGVAIISKTAIPYVTTTFNEQSLKTTFTNIYQSGQVELKEIYETACTQCPANFIYYYEGYGNPMRLWKLDENMTTYTEILQLDEIEKVLTSIK